jgi:hypothetical protein
MTTRRFRTRLSFSIEARLMFSSTPMLQLTRSRKVDADHAVWYR